MRGNEWRPGHPKLRQFDTRFPFAIDRGSIAASIACRKEHFAMVVWLEYASEDNGFASPSCPSRIGKSPGAVAQDQTFATEAGSRVQKEPASAARQPIELHDWSFPWRAVVAIHSKPQSFSHCPQERTFDAPFHPENIRQSRLPGFCGLTITSPEKRRTRSFSIACLGSASASLFACRPTVSRAISLVRVRTYIPYKAPPP